jgi:hypothetical protein
VSFETERDPSLRKGHNVKWLVRVEVLRSIDVAWNGGRKLAPVEEVAPGTIPDGFPEAGTPGLMLADVARHAAPADTPFENHLYRVLARDGTSLPRLLTWAEMHEAYYVPASDRIVMQEALGAAYQLSQPKLIRLEGGGS